MHKTVLAAVLAATTLTIATPVLADPPPWAHGGRDHGWDRGHHDRGGDYAPRRMGRNDRMWRGDDGRYYCRRSNGTTGLVVGAAVGGLLGNQIAGRGDKTLGTLLGVAGGGLLGREIDRGNVSCR